MPQSSPKSDITHDDDRFMREALAEAGAAAALGEVPIGAVLVHEGIVLARAHNLRESRQDPTAHAELVAIRDAAAALGSWRLLKCTLYVTLEPCAMCAGAIVLARIPRLVFGALDPKAGACRSLFTLTQDPRLNHRVEVEAEVLAEDSQRLLQDFFRKLRA